MVQWFGRRYSVVLSLLFVTALIDAVGLGIVYPVFSKVILGHLETFHLTRAQSNVVFGVLLAIYPLCMFIASPLLGGLADKYGRRRLLLITVFMNAVGFIVLALGIARMSLSWLIVGRVVSGLSSGNTPIAQSAAMDGCDPDKKSSRLALMSIANGLGFVLGPLIGAAFVFSGFGLLAAILVLNFLAILFYFKETLIERSSESLKQVLKVDYFRQYTSNRSNALLLAFFAVFIFGYFEIYQYLPVMVTLIFQQDHVATGHVMAFYALLYALSLMLVFPKFNKKYTNQSLLKIVLIGQPVFVAVLILIQSYLAIYPVLIVLAILFSFGYICGVTALSDRADANKQGAVMGLAQSATALGWGLSPLVSGVLSNIGLYIPCLLSVLMLVCANWLFYASLRVKN